MLRITSFLCLNMQAILEQFRANLDRVRSIHQLYLGLSSSVAPVIDLSDLLRAEVVLLVSALDHYIHELTRKGMLEVWRGERNATSAFQKFTVTLSTARLLFHNQNLEALIETEIRLAHSWKTFQMPDKIADAIRLFSDTSLWKEVALRLDKKPDDLKKQVELLIDRRNKIAHEADTDPSYPGQRWTIDKALVENAIAFIGETVEAVHIVASAK